MNSNSYSNSILPYIPFFYVIWSDDLLSASEIEVIKNAIHKDDSLNEDDKKQLCIWLNKLDPPKDTEIKNWQQIISSSKAKLVLGIQPNHYNHLFHVEVTQQSSSNKYDGVLIDQLLNQKYITNITTFRKFLEDDIFNWAIETNKEQARLKVLSQLQKLAKNGWGAFAYPPAYGGKEDMETYASIFEHLMFVDGSLAVKFGVQFGLFGGSIQNWENRPFRLFCNDRNWSWQ